MFKSLFASLMLATSFGTPNINTVVPKKAVNNNQLYGAYCFKDFTDIRQTFRDYCTDVGWDITDDILWTFNGNADMVLFYNDNYKNYYVASEISIEYSYQDKTLDINISADEDTSREYWTFVDENNSLGDTDFDELVLYFPNPVYADLNFTQFVNYWFTQSGNPYVTSYTGWYTFGASPFTNNVDSVSVMGNIIANNNLVNFIGKGATVYTRIYQPYTNDYHDFDLYSSNTWYGSRSVYFTGVLFPQSAKTEFNKMGVFDYVQEYEHYEFGQMIFSVVDAPIYMLSQLFSFELFGIQFYVAFMGITTIILICFVLRKII